MFTTKRIQPAIFLLTVLILTSYLLASRTEVFSVDQEEYQQIKKVTLRLDDLQHGLSSLQRMGLDIAGVDFEKGAIDVLVTEHQMQAVEKLLSIEVVRSEVVDIRRAPDSRYFDFAEVQDALTMYAQTYPDLVKLHSIGESLNGRPIWAIKISDQVLIRELNEPVILFNAMHHAREVMTTEVAMDTIEQLLTNYGSNTQITHWVDNTEIWIVPMVNPDGNDLVWTEDSMWRKNARGGYGVDINRNYPYQWNGCSGSSGSRWAQDYRGPSPASEPETLALMSLVAQIKPTFNVSYHSYSELVLYPLGCRGQRVYERAIVEGIGKQLASQLPSDSNAARTYQAGTSWELLYSVDGGDIDWMYHEHQVLPYVIELNAASQGFQPAYSPWRERTVQKARKAWRYMLGRVHQSGIRGVVSFSGNPSSDVTISVFDDQMQMVGTYQVKPDSSYHVVLNPGTYSLLFKSERGEQVRQNAQVGTNLVHLNVQI